MRAEELFAKQCVETVLPGTRMEYREEQHVRVHDFDLHFSDGSVAALEVGSATDSLVLQAEAALTDESRGGVFVTRTLSRHDWFVHPRKDARIDRVRRKVDQYLALIEAEGRTGFRADIDAWQSHGVARIAGDLRIEAGWVCKWKEPAIGLALLGGGGWLGPEPVQEAVREVASRSDNRQKLIGSERNARHLFVVIDQSLSHPWLCLREFRDGPMPQLSPEVTHCWVAGAYGSEAMGAHGDTRTGIWIPFGPIVLAEPAS